MECSRTMLRRREARLACSGEPLHAMLVGARAEAEELGHASIKFADRIRIEDFFFERERVACPAPFRAAAQIAFAIERDHRRFFEGGDEVGGCSVGGVVIDRNDAWLS